MNIPATRKDLMVVNMGPHHPSMHGVLRLIITLDGEDVIDCEPILGYLHRGMEKIAENRTIIQYLPYVTRWDYLATMFTEAITVNGPDIAVKARRVGGSTHQVPIEIRSTQGKALAIRWLLGASRKRPGRNMVFKLSSELVDAANGSGDAIRKKEETHRMAEANRAFAHFR